MKTGHNTRYIIAVSGSSGTVYALRILKYLSKLDCEVICILSNAAKNVYRFENESQNLSKKVLDTFVGGCAKLSVYSDEDISAPCASGSFVFDAMAIIPCSMNTLGKAAHSIADNLTVRTSDVALKERRRLVVVPRETPLALTHLKNMCALAEAGAVILPACPAFYTGENTVDGLVDFVAARVMSCMGIKQDILEEWGNGC